MDDFGIEDDFNDAASVASTQHSGLASEDGEEEEEEVSPIYSILLHHL